MTPAPRHALKIEVLVESERWKDAGTPRAVVRRAVAEAAAAMQSTTPTELAIVLTDDSTIRLLNREWRGIDAATNVLSFPAKNTGGRHLGDIVLAYETIAREAGRDRKPLAHHVAHLAVHGFLHLVGYDHERDEDALEMERTEREILQKLAIPDPYRPRRGDALRPSAGQRVRHSGKTRPGRTSRARRS